jgi:hypothetical protein
MTRRLPLQPSVGSVTARPVIFTRRWSFFAGHAIARRLPGSGSWPPRSYRPSGFPTVGTSFAGPLAPPRPAFRPRRELLDEFWIAAQPGPPEIFRQTGPALRCLADHVVRCRQRPHTFDVHALNQLGAPAASPPPVPGELPSPSTYEAVRTAVLLAVLSPVCTARRTDVATIGGGGWPHPGHQGASPA